MQRLAVALVLFAGVVAAVADPAVMHRGRPFSGEVKPAVPLVYGAGTPGAPPAAPKVVDLATETSQLADPTFKPTASPIVPANLKEPKPPVPHRERHPMDGPTFANLKPPRESKPVKAPKPDERVRAHILVRDTTVVEKPDPVTVRAHVIEPTRRLKHRRVHQYVTANAHITPDEPRKKRTPKVREYVTANAHITRDTPRVKRAKKEREYVTPIAHITHDTPRARTPKAKRVHEYVTPETHISRMDAPRAPEPKKAAEEPELVSADVAGPHDIDVRNARRRRAARRAAKQSAPAPAPVAAPQQFTL